MKQKSSGVLSAGNWARGSRKGIPNTRGRLLRLRRFKGKGKRRDGMVNVQVKGGGDKGEEREMFEERSVSGEGKVWGRGGKGGKTTRSGAGSRVTSFYAWVERTICSRGEREGWGEGERQSGEDGRAESLSGGREARRRGHTRERARRQRENNGF